MPRPYPQDLDVQRTLDDARISNLRSFADALGPDVYNASIGQGWDLELARSEAKACPRENRLPRHAAGIDSDPIPNVDPLPATDRRLLQLAGIRGPADPDEVDRLGRQLRLKGSVVALAAGLCMRIGQAPKTPWLAECGYEYSRCSLPDVARRCCELDNISTAAEPSHLCYRALTSPGATLAIVLGTAVISCIQGAFAETSDSTDWCGEVDLPRFTNVERASLALDGRLKEMGRGDEAEEAVIVAKYQNVRIKRYARKFSIDELDIVDDNTFAITDIAQAIGEEAARLRPDLVYSLLLANPTLVDGGAIFNATDTAMAGGHGNLGTAALSADGLRTAIGMMGRQRIAAADGSITGRTLNLRPFAVICPPDLETTAHGLIAGLVAARQDSPDFEPPRVRVDARIGTAGVIDPSTGETRTGSATTWFLAARRNGIEVCYRQGTGRRPTVRSYALGPGRWGVGVDLNFDLAAQIVGHQGLVRGNV